MMKTNTFKGSNVFMSRKLVPPEKFDALLDALKLNGADVFTCCDPSRNSPSDYHVISSPDHEKFEDLRAKGCNLIGPQCVFSCAKEHKQFPKQGFTCCLAMDGVKVLASGFGEDEKVKLEKLVKAMGGLMCSKATSDVSFVVVKNVLAAKYKWALHVLKKPIVTARWLHQCWIEHRIVPHESYGVLPFSGLTVSVTGTTGEERKKIATLVTQNGGKYSPDLLKSCTHLISDLLRVKNSKLQRDGVTFTSSHENGFTSLLLKEGGSAPSTTSFRGSLGSQNIHKKRSGQVASGCHSAAIDSNSAACQSADLEHLDVEEATLSQNMSSMFPDPSIYNKEDVKEVSVLQPTNETSFSNCVAVDSQSEDNDLYLADCRISLIGFEASELRKLVNMVRRGGGSRYVALNDKLTHVIIGSPTEDDKKELRSIAASGVVNVVRTTWLEDCDREKREVPVQAQHMAYELLLPKDSLNFKKGSLNGIRKPTFPGVHPDQLNVESGRPEVHSHQLLGRLDSLRTEAFPTEPEKERKQEVNVDKALNLNATSRQSKKISFPFDDIQTKDGKKIHDSDDTKSEHRKFVAVFMGKTFGFSKAFPEDRRAEVVEWINQGGGELADGGTIQNAHFTVEDHGVITNPASSCFVSTHWIRSCLDDGLLLDVDSHVLYSPLPCQIPFPGFGSFRFCASQYDEKDKSLLRNLCFVLGASFSEKLTKKVTHLLCKSTYGPKYKAACKWGITSVSSQWIFECVRENKVVDLAPFRPREVSDQDREDGFGTVSQWSSEAVKSIPGETCSQLRNESQDITELQLTVPKTKISSMVEEAQEFIRQSKKARNLQPETCLPSSRVYSTDPILITNSYEGFKDCRETSHSVPDVVADIDVILEQTGKNEDRKSPERTVCPEIPILPPPSVSSSLKDPLNSNGKREEESGKSSKDANKNIYYGFSETQTESQEVGYDADLSGIQLIIDRARTRSSLT